MRIIINPTFHRPTNESDPDSYLDLHRIASRSMNYSLRNHRECCNTYYVMHKKVKKEFGDRPNDPDLLHPFISWKSSRYPAYQKQTKMLTKTLTPWQRL